MIGTDLNLDTDLTGTMAAVIAKIATALEAIGDSIAQKATPAALDITSALSLNGNSLTDVAAVQLVAGNAPSTAGSIFYADGSFYGIDEVGIIQLTNNGQVNVLGSGGIVGDYGSVGINAVVEYDAASGEYRFMKDVGEWADIVCADVILEGTNGTVRLSAGDGITTSQIVSFEQLPAAGVTALVFDASDNGIKDGAQTRATLTQLVTSIDATGDYYHSATHSARIGMNPATRLSNCGIYTGDSMSLDTSGVFEWRSPLMSFLRTGDRIKSFDIRLTTAVAGTINVELCRWDATGGNTIDTYTFNPGTSPGLYSHTVAAPEKQLSGFAYFFNVTGNSAGLRINSLGVAWDHVA